MIIDDFKLWLKSNEERILQQGLRLVDVYKNITEKEIEKSVVYTYENFKYISQLTIRNDSCRGIRNGMEILPTSARN